MPPVFYASRDANHQPAHQGSASGEGVCFAHKDPASTAVNTSLTQPRWPIQQGLDAAQDDRGWGTIGRLLQIHPCTIILLPTRAEDRYRMRHAGRPGGSLESHLTKFLGLALAATMHNVLENGNATTLKWLEVRVSEDQWVASKNAKLGQWSWNFGRLN